MGWEVWAVFLKYSVSIIPVLNINMLKRYICVHVCKSKTKVTYRILRNLQQHFCAGLGRFWQFGCPTVKLFGQLKPSVNI